MGFPNMMWLTLLYAALAIGSSIALRRRVQRIVRRVDAKLVTMGVISQDIPTEAEAIT